MADRAPLLYLAALLHDLGKVFGKPEEGQSPPAEAQRLEDWRKKYCPPTCSRGANRCPVANYEDHALRGTVYLLARGLPPELREVALLVLSHHIPFVTTRKTACPDVFAELSQQLGCAIDPNGRPLLPPELRVLQELIHVADGLASSASRVDLDPRPFSRVWCSPYWVLCRPTFEPVAMAGGAAFSGHLFRDWALTEDVWRDDDLFSLRWEKFRSLLVEELEGTVEARHDSPDVRLWSHAAFTAAVALCYYRRQGSAPDFPKDGSKHRSGLAVACLTFASSERVVEVPSDGALRQVRGRAASLSLLTTGFAYSLLRELGLPPQCLLLTWDTGCFLLLYDTAYQVFRDKVEALAQEYARLPEIASPRIALAPVDVVRNGQLTLYLREAMRRTWQLAAYGHRDSQECELVYAGGPDYQPCLVGASHCGVCRTPLAAGADLCRRCRDMENLGRTINNRVLEGWGWHPMPRQGEAPPAPHRLAGLRSLGICLAPGGWPWRPPVGPGSPQQELEGSSTEYGSKPKIGIALVRCGVVAQLLSRMQQEEHLQPARLAECFRLADAFFSALHREEEGVWALRWSPAEVLLLGQARVTIELLAQLGALCQQNFGFSAEEMQLKVALAVCPLDAPWREAVDQLRSVLDRPTVRSGKWMLLADGTAFNPERVRSLVEHARRAGSDGKYALDALQLALSHGRRSGGYDVAAASSAVILLQARAQGARRQAVVGATRTLGSTGDTSQDLWSTLDGQRVEPEDLLEHLEALAEGGVVMEALADLALARRLLAD